MDLKLIFAFLLGAGAMHLFMHSKKGRVQVFDNTEHPIKRDSVKSYSGGRIN